MTRGFLLGKFLPPHNGHLLLCEAARALVDELTILVCWLPDDPIPGEQRLAWMRALVPDARVVGHGAVVPQAPEDHPDFWAIWRGIVRDAHPDPIDRVFASEAYGHRLATELGAKFHPVDPERLAWPVSGTAARADPWAHWPSLPRPVRAHFARTVCLHGPESTGKSMLSAALAAHYRTLHVPEYGRSWCAEHGNAPSPDDLIDIARTQDAMAMSMRGDCDRLLILDTDRLMTIVWGQMLHGRRDPRLEAGGMPADLYLMLEGDVPWIDDGTRLFGDHVVRRRFADICRNELSRRGVAWAAIAGPFDDRLSRAIAAIDAHFAIGTS